MRQCVQVMEKYGITCFNDHNKKNQSGYTGLGSGNSVRLYSLVWRCMVLDFSVAVFQKTNISYLA